MADDKIMPLVAKDEEEQVNRKLMTLVNEFPDIPSGIYKGTIQYEQLQDDTPSMAVSSIQGTYKTQEYINGGYDAENQFKIIYRIKPLESNDKRLMADELLNSMGAWLAEQQLDLGEGIEDVKIEQSTRSALFAAYENGDEDHQIFMRLTYHVNPRKRG